MGPSRRALEKPPALDTMPRDPDTERPTPAAPDPPGEAPRILRLDGPRRVALRREDRNRWILVGRDELPRGRPTLGLRIELARPDIGRGDSFTTERALGPSVRPLPAPPLPPGAVWLLAAVPWAGALVASAVGGDPSAIAFAGSIGGFGDLGGAILCILLTVGLLRWAEAMAIAGRITGDAPHFGLRRLFPKLEPVAWRLDPPATDALALVVLAGGIVALAAGWEHRAPAVAAGVATGGILHLLRALYPLRPGPGARILEGLTGTDDLPIHLRWSLLVRFLPMRTAMEARGGSREMAGAGLGLALWIALTGGTLHALAGSPASGVTPAGMVWRLSAVGGLFAFVAWLVWTVGHLFRDAARLGGRISLQPLVPPPSLRTAWAEENPLTRHVPELRSARWTWGLAPEGTLLVRHGAADRDFYWIGRGAVDVIGRSPGGDPRHLAGMGGGSGIGELGLLDGTPRSADVVAAEDCTVAILSHDEFRRVADEETEDRLGDLVRASQALARCPPLRGLAPAARDRWLARGRPRRHEAGSRIVRQGAGERWMGLVVEGSVAVERDGRSVTALGADSVIGEMAFLDDGRRTAALRAETDVLVWRWEGAWLDEEVDAAGVGDALRNLATTRIGEDA